MIEGWFYNLPSGFTQITLRAESPSILLEKSGFASEDCLNSRFRSTWQNKIKCMKK